MSEHAEYWRRLAEEQVEEIERLRAAVRTLQDALAALLAALPVDPAPLSDDGVRAVRRGHDALHATAGVVPAADSTTGG